MISKTAILISMTITLVALRRDANDAVKEDGTKSRLEKVSMSRFTISRNKIRVPTQFKEF